MDKRKKRIAIIGAKRLPASGGAERGTEEILKYLHTKYDFTVYQVGANKNKNDLDHLAINEVIFKGSRFKRINTLLYYLKAMFHAIFFSNYDLVHVRHLYSGFIVPFLRIRYRVLGTAHGIIPSNDNKWNNLDKWFFRIFEKLFLKFSNSIVSVSKPQISYLEKFTNKKIHYIPNGINIIEQVTNKKNKYQDYILFAAARIISLKGCHVFINALREINYSGKVIIIGDLDQVKKYKKEINNLSMGLDVDFLGLINKKSELLNYLKQAKLFIFPSFIEGMSNMLLEAASMQVPIICSDIPSNKAIFNKDKVLYFKAGDHLDLSIKIEWALLNYNQMMKNSKEAFLKLKKEFTWDKISNEYVTLYEQNL
jgi:glycosyltransferase involved in cell wall biosynthesis